MSIIIYATGGKHLSPKEPLESSYQNEEKRAKTELNGRKLELELHKLIQREEAKAFVCKHRQPGQLDGNSN